MAHRVAPRAETDLDEIWYYTAKESGSIEIANRLIGSITECFSPLPAFRISGVPAMKILAPGCRSVAVGEYAIVYCLESRRRACSPCGTWPPRH